MLLRESTVYQYLRAKVKEFIQLRKIKIKKSNEEFDVERTYQEYMHGISVYLEMLEKAERFGMFSKSSTQTNIYSYVYWIMTKGLLEESISNETYEGIKYVIENTQEEDGLCWDKNILNMEYINGDGWGCRHFMPHYFIALERMNMKPKYKMSYLIPFLNPAYMKGILDALDWRYPWKSSNFVMNIAVGLFYQRDVLGEKEAIPTIKIIQEWLLKNIREDCGMWGIGNGRKRYFQYQMLRGAYHLYFILIYDNIEFPYQKAAIDMIIDLQNKYGGFDIQANSSACEDIDAIEPLIRLSLLNPTYRKKDIENCIKKSLCWVVNNQMSDGGCVFRLGESLMYGSTNMYARKNESNLFATWFRTLSICYMYDYLNNKKRNYVDIAGYEYPLFRGRNDEKK